MSRYPAPAPVMEINHDYRKDTTLPPGKGYSVRPGGKPISIVIHTTNSAKKNTAFESEARYLRDSPAVGAHFLVGKEGQIAQLLHPDLAAWHAGAALSSFGNAHSIGIESHVSQGETWTGVQRDALTWLVRWLLGLYHIGPEMVETHRRIAQPAGRKSDPEGWPDVAFYVWRAALATPPVSLPKRYKIKGVPVYQQQQCTGPVALYLNPGTIVEVDTVYPENTAHLATGAGFIKLDPDTLEPVP